MTEEKSSCIPLTRLAAEFVVTNRTAELPQVALEVTRTGVTDTAATLLAGLNEPVTKIMVKVVKDQGGSEEAQYLFGAGRTTIEAAAMIDATAAHALDFDDYAFACHPSAILTPTILACGSQVKASGRELAAAYVCGYEVWADLMLREPDHLHSYGWHPTPIFGVIGAAAAAASLMKLNLEQTQNALGLAASHAAGNMGNFGSMAKPYHAGKAARDGIFSARMASHGMTATPDVIESKEGLLRSLSPKGRVDVTTPPDHYNYKQILTNRLNLKKYPTVGASQRAIDSVLNYLADNPVDWREIERIEPLISEKHAHIMFIHRPTTREEAKFSLEFAMACVLFHGRLGPAEMKDEAVERPEIQELIRKVSIVTTDEFDPSYPVAAPADYVTLTADYVTLTFRNGNQATTTPVKRATGHADVPLTIEQQRSKFQDCAEYGGLNPSQSSRLFELFQAIVDWKPEDLNRLRL
jgi:2-methylcitrate dehydratase PrpD